LFLQELNFEATGSLPFKGACPDVNGFPSPHIHPLNGTLAYLLKKQAGNGGELFKLI